MNAYWYDMMISDAFAFRSQKLLKRIRLLELVLIGASAIAVSGCNRDSSDKPREPGVAQLIGGDVVINH